MQKESFDAFCRAFDIPEEKAKKFWGWFEKEQKEDERIQIMKKVILREDLSRYPGELEINHQRGVIYFHRADKGITLLRINGLGPIPENVAFIDLVGCQSSYLAEMKARTVPDPEAKIRLGTFLEQSKNAGIGLVALARELDEEENLRKEDQQKNEHHRTDEES